MKKAVVMGRAKAAKIVARFEEINLVGSGLFTYQEEYSEEQYDAAYVICTLDEAKRMNTESLLRVSRALAIRIDQSCLSSESAFQTYFVEQIQPILSQSQQHRKSIKAFVMEWHQDMDQSILKTIILRLQYKQYFIIIRPVINTVTWQEYQRNILAFSQQILETDSILLSTLSVILSLPQIESADYSKHLLSIWRRVLPVGLGRLVLEDWSDTKQANPVSQLFYIKNMRMCWQLQFLTSHASRSDSLSQQILGLV